MRSGAAECRRSSPDNSQTYPLRRYSMNAVDSPWRRRATMLAAIALALAVYAFARMPDISGEERSQLAARFSFTRQPMPEIGGRTYKYVREVHPSLKRISAWMSSLGAAVTLADLDADGLPN